MEVPRPMLFSIVVSVLVWFCAVSCENGTNGGDFTKTVTIEIEDVYRRVWMSSDKSFKSFMNKLMRKAMPVMMREIYTRNISNDCLTGLLSFAGGLRKTKAWTFLMLDASAKIPVGLLSGTLAMLGNYEECLDIDVVEAKTRIQGKYCRIVVTPPLPEKSSFMSAHIRRPEFLNVSETGTVIDHLMNVAHNLVIMPIKAGVCIPSQCSVDDLQKLVQIVPQQTGLNWNFSVQRCEVRTETVLSDIQKVVLIAFGIVSFLLVLGTVVDSWSKTDIEDCGGNVRGNITQILRCFSIPSTVEKLCNYKPPDDTTRFVYGIIFISFIWVDCANTLYYINYDVTANLFGALHIIKILFYEVLLNRNVALQILFFVSGLISSYRVIKSDEDICPWKYILYRFLRYTPAYVMAIALVMLTPILGSGPSWEDYVVPMYSKCRDSWWANIFYVNNVIDPEASCLDNTWFFAVDAQLHVLGLLILIPLKRKPKLGLILCFGTIAVSLLTVALTNVYYDIPPAELVAYLHPTDRAFYASHTYNRVYTHLCIYCSGIVVGYLVVKKPHMNISKATNFVAWIVVVVGLGAVVISVHHWHMGEYLSSPLGAALYAAFSKAALAVCLSWTGYACCTGKGGMVNSVLGWRVFPGLCRLTFMAFLFNPVVIKLVNGFQKSHTFAGHFELLYLALNYIIPTMLVAIMCYIAFEGPVVALNQMMRWRCKSTSLLENAKTKKPELNGVVSEKPMRFSQMKHKQQVNNHPTTTLSSENHTKF